MAPWHSPGMRRCGRACRSGKAADSRAAQCAQGRPRTSVGLAADRDAASWVPGLLVATTGPGDHSTVSGRSRETRLPASPNPRPAPAQPRGLWEAEARGGPHPCGWLAPGCPCGLQEGLRAHLRPISQSNTQMFPLVALGKHSVNCRATKSAVPSGGPKNDKQPRPRQVPSLSVLPNLL